MSSDNKTIHLTKIRNESLLKWNSSDTAHSAAERASDQAKIHFMKEISLLAAVNANDIDDVSNIIKKVNNINFSNSEGLTSLHRACINCNFPMIRLLVENGADINVVDGEMWTPLHVATVFCPLEIIQYLVDHGADLTAINSDLDLPQDLAETPEKEEYFKNQILKRGIDTCDIKESEKRAILNDLQTIRSLKDINDKLKDSQGVTPLHVAAAKGYIDVAKILLSKGFDPNVRDNDGWTPLHAAVYWKDEDICSELLMNGADPNAVNKAGNTPIQLSSKEFEPIITGLASRFKKFVKTAPPLKDNGFKISVSKKNKEPPGILKSINKTDHTEKIQSPKLPPVSKPSTVSTTPIFTSIPKPTLPNFVSTNNSWVNPSSTISSPKLNSTSSISSTSSVVSTIRSIVHPPVRPPSTYSK